MDISLQGKFAVICGKLAGDRTGGSKGTGDQRGELYFDRAQSGEALQAAIKQLEVKGDQHHQWVANRFCR